ncbi:hypothetical protein bthur0011_18870 [Bacillus thuringiensis serovar huazhongensis BGSC 4BD1]|nr:hypothetical protein bthur0011_18870 [Bacillus thuringiensis serovar huazhongensis BGSC 4BD1]
MPIAINFHILLYGFNLLRIGGNIISSHSDAISASFFIE